MRAVCASFAIGLFALATSNVAVARDATNVATTRSLPDFSVVDPPPAFKVFCQETPQECMVRFAAKGFETSAARLAELDDVNRQVNHTIVPETDIEHYGVEDYWTIPKDGKGDCEDYALLKRHILISKGWPTSALLMTVVRAENGEGHAVLTARTNSGELILDNRSDQLKYWFQTAYAFKMRQSPNNPRVWLDLDPADDVLPAPIAELERLFGVEFRGRNR